MFLESSLWTRFSFQKVSTHENVGTQGCGRPEEWRLLRQPPTTYPVTLGGPVQKLEMEESLEVASDPFLKERKKEPGSGLMQNSPIVLALEHLATSYLRRFKMCGLIGESLSLEGFESHASSLCSSCLWFKM